jgi:alkylation response protein AidB-like acyl-CoA dehydrogenase
VTIGPEEKKLGIKGSSTTQVIFEGAKVPVGNVLGEIGKGHKIAFNVLNVGRYKLGAAVNGGTRKVIGIGAAYANQRKQFGVPISSFGAIREKLADRTADFFASEALVFRLAGMIDDRLATLPKDAPRYYESYQAAIEEYAIECAIAKVFCSEVLADVVDDVVQIHGGYGFTQEYPAERFYRDERINRIFEGTNEINRMLVPGTLFRRALKGELPLFDAAFRAAEAIEAARARGPGAADSGPFGPERTALRRLKDVFLALAGAAAGRFGEALKDEQEVLLALADVAIQVFAAESAILRAEKTAPLRSDTGRTLAAAAVKVHTFSACEKIGTAARRAAFYVGEGAAATALLRGVDRLTAYDATGLLDAKRALAQAVLEGERYPF